MRAGTAEGKGKSVRIMAVYLGDARTGVAFSDPGGSIAGETFVEQSRNAEKLMARLCELAAEKKAEKIVMGLPLNMDGSEGERAQKCRRAAEELSRRSGIEVVFQDERRTTVDAHRILSEMGRATKKHRKNVDAVAASLILETYLNRRT